MIPIVVDTQKVSRRAKLPLKSTAEDFDGLIVGCCRALQSFCANNSAPCNGLYTIKWK
jgi:hypothetical protein